MDSENNRYISGKLMKLGIIFHSSKILDVFSSKISGKISALKIKPISDILNIVDIKYRFKLILTFNNHVMFTHNLYKINYVFMIGLIQL